MKAILFENMGLSNDDIHDWVKSKCPNYTEINSEVRDYRRSQDLWFFALLIDPELTDIFTSSAFSTQMPYEAMRSFEKIDDNKTLSEQFDDKFHQIEYFMWLIREAVWYRERNKLGGLTVHINYLQNNFIRDVDELKFGEEMKSLLKLTLRQFESHFKLNVYQYFMLQQSYTNEDQLNFK